MASSGSASGDPFVELHEMLGTAHRALTHDFGALPTLGSTDSSALVGAAGAAARFLLWHHHAESSMLFPALRKHNQLRSTDVAFLEGLDHEHRELHALGERLLAEIDAPHPRQGEILLVANVLSSSFAHHFRQEEEGLSPERLRTMIDRAGLEELARQREAVHAKNSDAG